MFFTPMCGLWWKVQNLSTFPAFPQTTLPSRDFQDTALKCHFQENQPHRHLMREVCESQFVKACFTEHKIQMNK